MKALYETLIERFKTQDGIARAFGVTRPAVSIWKKVGVPELIATISHLDPTIPYTYDPAHYGRDTSNLALSLAKPKHNHNNKQAA